MKVTIISNNKAIANTGEIFEIEGLEIVRQQTKDQIIYRPGELDDDGDDFFRIACPPKTIHFARLNAQGKLIIES